MINFQSSHQPQHPLMGLAPFLRMNIAGDDMSPIGKDLLERAENPDDSIAMMDLSTYMQCIGQHDLGLTIQQQALQLRHSYVLQAKQQPAKLRLLALMAAGDLSCNMPVDCLLENSDVDLELFYVSPQSLLEFSLPEHDVLLVAIGESDSNQALLRLLEPLLINWPKPVLNTPAAIPLVARDTASKLLQGVPGLLIPPTLRVTRADLIPIIKTSGRIITLLKGYDFPMIIRPVGSHAGNDLKKIDNVYALSEYLALSKAVDFFVSAFIDYQSADGQFRKYRIALIDGVPYACHMAVSSHWMVHYVNAGMYLDATKRKEEERFIKNFNAFSQRHATALKAIHQRSRLEYVCMDCAETRDGKLFIFEIDHAMVVHALDTAELFPYKQQYMQNVLNAFRALLYKKARRPTHTPAFATVSRAISADRLNFSGGPGVLPESVLQQIQEAIAIVPEVGLSLLGISHRSDWFAAVVKEAEQNIRTLLGVSDNYHVLFLQGGATQQFSMVPMTLLHNKTEPADYLHTGYWSGKAIPEARREGNIRTLWDGSECGFRRLPSDAELDFSGQAPYLHYVSNETVEGLQFQRVLGRDDVPRVCDMSSDFLSRPCEAKRFSLIYAHAQKNLGPAGVTVVIVRDELLKDSPADLPGFLNYHNHVKAHSNYNTPPVFAVYVVLLVTRWLLNEIGGVENMARINQSKASALYRLLDQSEGFYRGRASDSDRSQMNVVFNLASSELEKKFLTEALSAGFHGLGGHRSIGGIRASLYNALTLPAVHELATFMDDFKNRNQVKHHGNISLLRKLMS